MKRCVHFEVALEELAGLVFADLLWAISDCELGGGGLVLDSNLETHEGFLHDLYLCRLLVRDVGVLVRYLYHLLQVIIEAFDFSIGLQEQILTVNFIELSI